MSSAEAPKTSHAGEYRKYLPDLSIPRFQIMKQQDAHVYAQAFKTGHQPPWLYSLYQFWLSLLEEPFVGVTSDGMQKIHTQEPGQQTYTTAQALYNEISSNYKMKAYR